MFSGKERKYFEIFRYIQNILQPPKIQDIPINIPNIPDQPRLRYISIYPRV